MKRLIVVIISILFLSVFLMMNFLLWDKDNLLKQQESDKVQQDWLRGQNKEMEANISELEQAAGVLEKDKAALNEQNNSLQRQLRAATDRETSLRRTLDERILSVEALKTSSLPILKETLAGWMAAVSEGRSADSFLWFSRDFNFMQQVMTQETYQKYVETHLQALSFLIPEVIQQPAADAAPGDAKTDGAVTTDLKPTGVKISEVKPVEGKPAVVKPTATPEPAVLFERIGNEAADLEVLVRTQIYATLKPDGDVGSAAFTEGLNTVQVLFVYDVINQKWYIQLIKGN